MASASSRLHLGRPPLGLRPFAASANTINRHNACGRHEPSIFIFEKFENFENFENFKDFQDFILASASWRPHLGVRFLASASWLS